MKIEPGTLCVVRGTYEVQQLRGRILVAVRMAQIGEDLGDGPFGLKLHVKGSGWIVEAPDKSPSLPSVWVVGGRDEIFPVARWVINAEFLIPISGPGLDLSEKWEREIEDDGDESGFKARRVARLAGDDSWD
jgi:hypothetical protein